jgi:hypothetical protein
MEAEINMIVSDYVEGRIDSKELSRRMNKFDNGDVFEKLQMTNPELISVIDVASDLSYLESEFPNDEHDLLLKDYYEKTIKPAI